MKNMSFRAIVVLVAVLAQGAFAEEDGDDHGDEHDDHGDEHDDHGDDHDDHGDEADGHDGHHPGAGGAGWEWAGTFATPEDTYVWVAQTVDVDGVFKYVDDTMDIVVLKAEGTTAETLHTLEAKAEGLLNGTCTKLETGSGHHVEVGKCFKLEFDKDLHTSYFSLDLKYVDTVAIFAQHFPIEFERDQHYLHDLHGEDVEPVAELPEDEEEEDSSKPWGTVIGAAIIVNICTLSGVIFLAPFIAQKTKENPSVFGAVTNSFAAGALLSCALYLMLYEATHLIVRDTEAQSSALWGSMILLGFIISGVSELVVQAIVKAAGTEEKINAKDVESVDNPHPDPSRRVRVLCGVLIGDFIHNFVDGIFIGAGFSGCGDNMGWSITAATVYHEIAQEVADYLVLTDPKQGALQPLYALVFNFVSGISVILGAITILSQDDMDNLSFGCLLAFGGGVYVQIGAVECMPRVMDFVKDSIQLRLGALCSFAVGAISIGLVLLDHEHCSAGGGGHEGHGHK